MSALLTQKTFPENLMSNSWQEEHSRRPRFRPAVPAQHRQAETSRSIS